MAEPSIGHGQQLMILLEEYKLVQSKIDKLGEFRFIVRGWAITVATGGAVVAGSSIWALFFLIPALFCFWGIEEYENRVAKLITGRAFQIEREIWKLMPLGEIRCPSLAFYLASGRVPHVDPDLARELRRPAYFYTTLGLFMALAIFLAFVYSDPGSAR
jgi:hypothetical protein